MFKVSGSSSHRVQYATDEKAERDVEFGVNLINSKEIHRKFKNIVESV